MATAATMKAPDNVDPAIWQQVQAAFGNKSAQQLKTVLQQSGVPKLKILACNTRVELLELTAAMGITKEPDEWGKPPPKPASYVQGPSKFGGSGGSPAAASSSGKDGGGGGGGESWRHFE